MVGGITSLVSQLVALPRIILLSHRSYLPVTWRRLFSDSLVICRDSGYRHPIIKPADEVSCTRRRSPVGSSFPCQLIHLYPRTTDHCQWETTYAATEEALNWKAIILSIGLFVILFLIGFAWNKLKWPLLQRKELKKEVKSINKILYGTHL